MFFRGFGKKKEAEVAETPVVEIDETLTVIDREIGIKYCGGIEELYNEVASQYAEQGMDYVGKLNTYFEEKDWKNYQIIVHAIKSSSLTIGAVALSEKAKSLEMAAKEDNHEYIEAEHAVFIKSFQCLLEKM